MSENVEREARDLMYQAADLIDECGWVTSSYGSKHTGFCAVGALRFAAVQSVEAGLAVHNPSFRRARRVFASWLQSEGHYPEPQTTPERVITNWNDEAADSFSCTCPNHGAEPRRSQVEVSAALRKAADTITLEDL